MRVPYNYLDRQFGAVETETILDDLRALVRTGEFTIGPPVLEFERRFGEMIGVKHVIGTNTGTDALILALRALNIRPGDEVITQVNTFYATVGAIVAVGARPVFVDVDDQYAIDPGLVEEAITPRTRAILPVYWTGLPPDMPAIMGVARRHGLRVVEDACPATGAAYAGKAAGSFGDAAGFSMHPLKPLHVWGDGGAVTTDDDQAAEWLRRYRNHGMVNRDEIEMWGVNQRLQTVQAVVANRMLDRVAGWVDRRIEIANRLDAASPTSRRSGCRHARPSAATRSSCTSSVASVGTSWSSILPPKVSRPRCTIRSRCISSRPRGISDTSGAPSRSPKPRPRTS